MRYIRQLIISHVCAEDNVDINPVNVSVQKMSPSYLKSDKVSSILQRFSSNVHEIFFRGSLLAERSFLQIKIE